MKVKTVWIGFLLLETLMDLQIISIPLVHPAVFSFSLFSLVFQLKNYANANP